MPPAPPPPDTAIVVNLDEIGLASLPLVGGKAANLGELTRAGFPVPAGVCVTTPAYQQIGRVAGVAGLVEAIAATPAGDVAALTALAGQIRTALLGGEVPREVRVAIAEGYAGLGEQAAVAVRSSATAEDLPLASFAGQQDTYLNVVGEQALLDAVRRCWASLWTDRAVVYRAANGIDPHSVRLAVVIQHMVDAQTAGVLFTADPVTGRRRRAVIDASPGLGEAVVSGAVNPDRLVVDTATGTLLARQVGDKRLAVRPVPGGGVQRVSRSGGGAGEPCMTDEQARALAALGERVEAHYGSPQDIEWAIDATGTIWLTQARAITTVYPLPPAAPRTGEELRVYFCGSLAQGLHRPLTPMGLAAFRLLASSVASQFGFTTADPRRGPAPYAEAGQRFFIDVTPVLRSRPGRALAPRVLDVMEARSAVVLRGLFDETRLAVTHTSWWPFLRRVLHMAARHRFPVRAVHALAAPSAARRAVDRAAVRRRALLRQPGATTPAARLDLAEHALLHQVVPVTPTILPVAAVGFAMLGVAGRLLGPDARPGDLQTVLRGLPHNVTTEMDLALWQLVTRVRADPAAATLLAASDPGSLAGRYRDGDLPPVLQDGLAGFLETYGHRAVAEIDIGLPRWSEDPRHILGVMANYLRLDGADAARAPDAAFARASREAEEMIDRLVRRAARRSRIRGALVRFCLSRTRALAGLRELPKYHMVLTLAGVREQLRQVGAALAGASAIDAAPDVFFLDLSEARAGLAGTDLRRLVAERRDAYDAELRRRHVPRVLLSDGTEPEAAALPAVPTGALTGTAASAGTVTGVARVVLDPVGAVLQPGEILVAPSTDPGWTPLFLTAGGLVMEMGGANSHGAVVAREYGIPAVVGVPGATTRITTGQRITVDGTAGRIGID
ncbi:MAG TPA: PEP/pyruvate-binding domain-containing protein [Micromonosporaceae bacterium]|nr:PEP/pyruvate-binding domain-containing protein [Micromonosporaceae bacterium]